MSKRGQNNRALPNKLYFIETAHGIYYGPYQKKPTALMNQYFDSKLIIYVLSKDGNYERE